MRLRATIYPLAAFAHLAAAMYAAPALAQRPEPPADSLPADSAS